MDDVLCLNLAISLFESPFSMQQTEESLVLLKCNMTCGDLSCLD